MQQRLVIDTNIYVSFALRNGSLPGRAVRKAWLEATLLQSEPTWIELKAVLMRPKFSRFFPPNTLQIFLEEIHELSEMVDVRSSIKACRDPRDDKFLELAVDGEADLILTGDADLLTLNPFRKIGIITPAQYLELP